MRLVTVDYKRDRVTISKQCLEMFQCNPDEFLRRFITVDERWIHYFTGDEQKEQSKQWTSPGESALKKKTKTVNRLKRFLDSFLECTRYNSYRLPSVEATDQCDYYAVFIGLL